MLSITKSGYSTIDSDVIHKINMLKSAFPDGKPIGITFETANKKYLYDTNSGKVMECGEVEHVLLQKILTGAFDEVEELINVYGLQLEVAIDNILNTMREEKILEVAKFKKMLIPENFESLINNGLRQIVIELTEKCNLRCGYCIYNEGCSDNRNFGTKDMSDDIALKAVDYAITHSNESDELAITFYGGEPLIKYDLMKKCINYAIENIHDKELSFSFTTNGVLMTKIMAEELARIEKINILFSIDGPKEIHDLYRRNAEGKGSFEEALRGLRYVVEAFGEKAKDTVYISMVYAPPYSTEKLQCIQEFFDGLEWLPNEVSKYVTYPSEESNDCINVFLQKNSIPKKFKNESSDNSLLNWSNEQYNNKSLFTKKVLNDVFTRIYKRQVFSHTLSEISMNGCCVPGQRRIYITVNGDFKICERVGKIPYIGDLKNGINMNIVREKFLHEYTEKSFEQCSVCWASRLCNLCYSHSYDENGFNVEKRNKNCESVRGSFGQGLCLYFEKLESNPNYFDFIEDIKLK